MAKLPGSTYKRLIVTLIVVCVAALSVIIGSMVWKDGRLRLPFFAQPAGTPEPPVRVTYVTEFTKCGHEKREVKNVEADEVSSLLAAAAGQWTVVRNDGTEIELRRQQDYCPEHLRERLITFHKGYLCVFRGSSANPALLVKERADIKEADLMQRDRDLLKAGYTIVAPPEVLDTEADTWLNEQVGIWLEGIKED